MYPVDSSRKNISVRREVTEIGIEFQLSPSSVDRRINALFVSTLKPAATTTSEFTLWM
jgi:hypothetical protein